MIPVLDASRAESAPAAFAAEFGQALRGPGFCLLERHALPAPLVQAAFAQARAFFALPEARKAPLSIAGNDHNRGWAAIGSERLDPGSGQADRKEAFNMGLDLAPDDPRIAAGEPFRGVNVWPGLPDFAPVLRHYFDAALGQGLVLMAAAARDLGLPADHFAPSFAAPMATLRLLSYPAAGSAGGGDDGGDGIGAGAHTDYGALTLLMTDGAPGLQVRPRGGDWTDMPHRPGALVVNVGDCLMRWTNDIYVSTPHRVLPPPRPRHSIAFFLDPDPDAVIAALPGTGPARYPPVAAADYLRGRLQASYATQAAP